MELNGDGWVVGMFSTGPMLFTPGPPDARAPSAALADALARFVLGRWVPGPPFQDEGGPVGMPLHMTSFVMHSGYG